VCAARARACESRPADQGQRRLSPVVRELRPGAPGHLRGPIGHRGANRGEVACRFGPTPDHERLRGIRSAAAGPSPDAAAERAGAARVPQAARAGSRSRPEIRGRVVCTGHRPELCFRRMRRANRRTRSRKPRRQRAGRTTSIPPWRSRSPVLANLHEVRGDWVEADRLYDRAVALDSADPTSQFWRANNLS
jgi:hypothetical protein